MMRLLISLCLLIGITLIGVAIDQTLGTVTLQVAQWEIKTSSGVVFGLGFLGLIIGKLCLDLIIYTLKTPQRWASSWRRYTQSKLENNLIQGFEYLAEGNWAQAEKAFSTSAAASELALINYLQAATAAHAQGLYAKRDDYLREAILKQPKAKLPILLQQARLQLDSNESHACIVTLNQLIDTHAKHPEMLRLQIKAYAERQEWYQVKQRFTLLRRHHRVLAPELKQLECLAHKGCMRDIATQQGKQALVAYWNGLDKAARKDEALIIAFATLLVEIKAHTEAESFIRRNIKTQWHPVLITLYGVLKSDNLSQQLNEAELWLKTHQQDATLLLTLARICQQAQLWGKARDYLQASLSISPSAEVFAELAALSARLGDAEKSRAYYQQGLESVVNKPVGEADGKVRQQLLLVSDD